MKTLEKILIAMAFLGLVFQYLHWPGANELQLLGLSLLAQLYFIFGFALFNQIRFRKIGRKSFSEVGSAKIIGAIGSGIPTALVILGILFKIQLWQGRDDLLGTSLYLLLPVVIFLFLKRSDRYYRVMIKRVSVLTLVGLFFFSLSTRNLVAWNLRDTPELIQPHIDFLENPNKETKENLKNARNALRSNELHPRN